MPDCATRSPSPSHSSPQWVPWTKLIRAQNGTLSIQGPMGNLLDVFSTSLRFESV